MRKRFLAIPAGNILFSILFILGFFAGTIIAAPEKGEIYFDLSANAIMDIVPKQKENKSLKTLASVLPILGDEAKKLPNTTPVPNYITDAPVLASDGSEKIKIKNDTNYEIDIDAMLAEPLKLREGEVQVLILHTHTSEAYTKTRDADYVESDPYRTQESDKNIVLVGREVAKVLTENGIGVIHDETYHDYPSYTGSYRRALETITKNTEENKGITLILDIHRDALQNGQGEYMKTLAEINGEKMAQALLVIGTDGSGLEHPNWRENLKWGLRLQKIMKEKYPSLTRDLHLCNERYNGHAGSGAMIIEIGSNGNTLPEAVKCANLVGECIVSLVEGVN